MTYLTIHRPSINPFKYYSMLAPIRRKANSNRTNWMPSTDITETDDSFVVRAELPGVSIENVTISVKEDLLTLKGEKHQQDTSDSVSLRRVERRFGSFERKFTLPPKITTDEIKAEYRDGILTLSIPKPDEVKPKEISIVTESSEF